jgi:hypothetical protein
MDNLISHEDEVNIIAYFLEIAVKRIMVEKGKEAN